MPAGDLITTDYQLEINALLLGAGTDYQVDPTGVTGLGLPQTKTADTAYDGRDGSAGSTDFLDVRIISVPIRILGETPEAAYDDFLALLGAWAPARDAVDVELHIQLPGLGHIYFNGRPRGVTEDLSQLKNSDIGALCRFDALDPTAQAYTP